MANATWEVNIVTYNVSALKYMYLMDHQLLWGGPTIGSALDIQTRRAQCTPEIQQTGPLWKLF